MFLLEKCPQMFIASEHSSKILNKCLTVHLKKFFYYSSISKTNSFIYFRISLMLLFMTFNIYFHLIVYSIMIFSHFAILLSSFFLKSLSILHHIDFNTFQVNYNPINSSENFQNKINTQMSLIFPKTA